jgi:glycosyltransferase involved in cell wall biosynthesis
MQKSRTHILYIAEFSTGGSVESLLVLLGGLDKRRFRATALFYSLPDEAICARVEAAGAELDSLYPRASGKATRGQLKKYNLQTKVRKYLGRRIERAYESVKFAIYFLRFRRQLYKDLRRKIGKVQPDLVHLNTGIANDTPAALATWMCGVPTISHVRDFDKITYLTILAARSMRAFICISSAVRDHLVASGLSQERCVIVPNAVDLKRFDESSIVSTDIRNEFGWGPKDTVFVLVGRLVGWKGQDDFIQAVAIARDSDPSIRGLIVGEGDFSEESDAYIARLDALIGMLELGDAVRFSGHRTDVPEIMKSADAVVCPSSSPEPFGRVIIESMAVGTPVIATAAGGATDIITHGANGVLIPPRDSAAMAAAFLQLGRDSALASELCSEASRAVKDRYTVERHVHSVSEIYSSVLDEQ